MIRRALALVLTAALLFLSAGCWNYRGLDQLSIVVGIAVDYDKQNGLFQVSYELVDLPGTSKEAAIKSKIISATGQTLFDAARNAKKKEADWLFFGAAQVLIIGHKLVEEMGVLRVVDWILRDAECREALCVAISQEDTASEILVSSEKMSGMMSAILWEIILEDNEHTATTPHVELFQIFNELNTPVYCVAIPVLHRVRGETLDVTELNGSAIIHEDRLVGYLSPEMGRYLLMLQNDMKGGRITLPIPVSPGDFVSLEVIEASTKIGYRREGETPAFDIKATVIVALQENNAHVDLMDHFALKDLEDKAAKFIEENIRALVHQAQHEMKVDFLELGEIIYRRDYKYWEKIKDNWTDIFQTVPVNVSARVVIRNSGFIK